MCALEVDFDIWFIQENKPSKQYLMTRGRKAMFDEFRWFSDNEII
jgi:hypothetical protein